MTIQGDYMMMIWLGLMVAMLIIELFTVGLTTIWAAAGALVALLLSACNVPLLFQIIAFFAVTILLLIFTRPFAMKFINSNRVKTNYESLIGQTIRISERVDNISETGKAVVKGQEWTVRTEQDENILEAGTLAKVVEIAGVKLIVERVQEEK